MKKLLFTFILSLLLLATVSCGTPKGTVGTVSYYLGLDLSDYLRLEDSDLKDLSVTVSRDLLVTESEVSRRIDSMLLQYATVVTTENIEEHGLLYHRVGLGDSISIYYYATDEDGNYVPFFSNCFEPSVFRVGNSGFIPGFDEGVADLSLYIWETSFFKFESGEITANDSVFASYKITYPTASGLGTHTVKEGTYERIDVSRGDTLASSLIGQYLGRAYNYEKIEDVNGDGESELVTYSVTPHFIGEGEMRDFTLTVPEGYSASVGLKEEESYDGKTLTFHIAIEEYHIMPELDRLFLMQKLGYFGTVETYRQKVLTDMMVENGFLGEITTQAFNKLLERVELKKYPRGAVESYVTRLKSNITENHRYFTLAYAYNDRLVQDSTDDFFNDKFGYIWKYNSFTEYQRDFPDKTEEDYEKHLAEYNKAKAYYRDYYDKQFEKSNGFAWKYQDDVRGFAKDIFNIPFENGETLDSALRRHCEKLILQDLLFFTLAEEFGISFTQSEIAYGYTKYVNETAKAMGLTVEDCVRFFEESYDAGYLSDRALYEQYNEAIAKKLFSYVTVNYQ